MVMTIDKKELAAMLVFISDWCIEHCLGSGIFRNAPEEEFSDAIFPNGNYVRVMICSYELTGEPAFLDEATSWCDYFVDVAANPVTTSGGNDAVWWWDYNKSNLYLADTGTAIHALFKIFPHVDSVRQTKYLDTFKKFYRLIAEGTDCDPMGRGQEPSPGWIITDGQDAGAFGVGYRRGRLERRPYTVSTATAGAQACAALYKLTGDPTYRETALGAARWLIGQFQQDGHIPYRIEGIVDKQHLFQGIHYSLEGLLTSWLYLDDEEYRDSLREIAPRIMKFVLRSQNEKGYWGTEREYDGQRTAFLAHFLHWYHDNIEPDEQAEQAAEKFAGYVLDPRNTARYGVCEIANVTGFVGLAFASFIYPELDIRHPFDPIPLCDYSVNELRTIADKWKKLG